MIIKAYKNGKEIDLNLLLTRGFKSQIRILYTCDGCKKEKEASLESLIKHNHIDKQYCLSCSMKLNDTVTKRRNTCIEKYDVDNPMKSSTIVERYKVSALGIYDKQRNDYNDIKDEFTLRRYKLVSDTYKNRTEYLEYICPEGHRGRISWASFKKGSGCKVCSNSKISDTLRHSIEYVKEEFDREGYTLLSNYHNNKQKLKYLCPKGHIGEIRFDTWTSGHRCNSCSHIVSRSELEIYDYLANYFPDIERSNRSIISPLELDIVIPSKKVAIEYCGLYWHSELNGKDKWYHYNKLQRCQSQGYSLITVFEDEWTYKREIVLSRLRNILGIPGRERIYARNCDIKEITPSIKNKFLDDNHIQGRDNSSVKLGAYYDGILVSVMTFSSGSIAKGNSPFPGVYELNRFCSARNTSVIGIASKLLKYFVENYNPTSVFSYADKRWSTGGLYSNLGFSECYSSEPNYWYIENSRRVHRFNFRKSILSDKLPQFSTSLSEWENMKENGYDRIWDCGNLKFTKEMS